MWNTERRFQGHRNSPLTAKGIKEITSMGQHIRNVQFGRAYCSPLGRTRQTMEHLAPDCNEIIYDDRIKEIALGMLEGCYFDQVPSRIEDEHKKFWDDPENFSLPGAETFFSLHSRVMNFIEEVKNSPDPVLLVTHTVPIRIILSWIKNRSISQIWKKPSISAGSLIKIDGTVPKLEEIISPA